MRYERIYYRKMHSKTLKKLFKTAGNYTEIRIPGGKYLGISIRILISLNKNNDVLQGLAQLTVVEDRHMS